MHTWDNLANSRKNAQSRESSYGRKRASEDAMTRGREGGASFVTCEEVLMISMLASIALRLIHPAHTILWLDIQVLCLLRLITC